jgi:hypothetical protein
MEPPQGVGKLMPLSSYDDLIDLEDRSYKKI